MELSVEQNYFRFSIAHYRCMSVFTFSQFDMDPGNDLGGSRRGSTCGDKHELVEEVVFNLDYSLLVL